MARILIVESDFLRAVNLQTLLSEHGNTVCGIAHTAEQGISLAASKEPDVVVMGVKLSDQSDVFETAKRIKETRSCSLIFLTGYSDSEILGRLEALSPIAVLVKPAAREAVIEAVGRSILQRAGGRW